MKVSGFVLLLFGSTLVFPLACGTGDGESPAPREPAAEEDRTGVPRDTPLGKSVIRGTVKFRGTPPVMQPIDMRADPVCVSLNEGPVHSEEVLVHNGCLENVFVYVKTGLETYKFHPPSQPVRLMQKGCRYEPHVAGIMVDQQLRIVNSDPTLHNIHCLAEKNPKFNIGQPVQGMETDKSFAVPEVMIRFRCHVHPWMSCYLGVLPHPYFRVTGEDGAFVFDDLPPGDYTIEAWHERFGTQIRDVGVSEEETGVIEFTFSGS